jgi:hypothetical protein
MQSSKSRFSSLLAASTAFAAHLAFGCGDISVEPIQSKIPVTHVVESDDPYACKLVPTGAPPSRNLEDGFAPTCKANGEPCNWDASGTYVADTTTYEVSVHQEVRMVCLYPCQVDSDCPAPESGTAHAGCFFFQEPSPENPFGHCVLDCEGGETCPRGFECKESIDSTDSCIGSGETVDYSYVDPPATPPAL